MSCGRTAERIYQQTAMSEVKGENRSAPSALGQQVNTGCNQIEIKLDIQDKADVEVKGEVMSAPSALERQIETKLDINVVSTPTVLQGESKTEMSSQVEFRQETKEIVPPPPPVVIPRKVEMIINEQGCVALIIRGWKPKNVTGPLFGEMYTSAPWAQNTIGSARGDVLQPRLTFSCGDHPGLTMNYGARKFPLAPWIPGARRVRDDIRTEFKVFFDSCHGCLYRNGQDSIYHHSDRESLGACQAVYALSLGATREFQFKQKEPIGMTAGGRRRFRTIKVLIHDGDLMAMFGRTQELWTHGIDKTDAEVGVRIALTYRVLYPDLAPPLDPAIAGPVAAKTKSHPLL